MYSTHLKPLWENFQNHWFRITLALLCLYVVAVKDISFQFALNNASAHPSQTNGQVLLEKQEQSYTTTPVVYHSQAPANRPAKKAKQSSFSIWDFFKFKKEETTKVVPLSDDSSAPTSLSASQLVEANNFSNLGFLLNPSIAKRRGVDPAIVQHKKEHCMKYLKRFAPVAVAEMNKYGIPASITLAQALLESNAGDSQLTRKNANHFGIKCFSKKCGKGHCSNFMDDGHKDFFRKYKSAWDSFRDHSIFLNRKRYQHLQALGTKDYIGWARGLKAAGYATDKKYAEKLIRIIEVFQLYELDE